MNDRLKKALAASVLALALTSSAFAGGMQTGNNDDPPPCEETQTCSSASGMDNSATTNGGMQTGATDSDGTWMTILLSLLNSVPF